MRKVKLFLTPHIEIRIHVSEEKEKPVADTGWKDHYRGRFEKVE